MRTGMSVPEVVRELITRNRSIYDCMKMDLINYTALAVRLQPEVERQVGNTINLNTIVVAIKRYADSFEKADEESADAESALKNARLSLTDGIMDVRFSAAEMNPAAAAELVDRFSQITTDYEFFRMTDSFRVLAEDIDAVRHLFDSFPGGGNVFNTGLARIKVFIGASSSRSDAVSHVAEILHAGGIELVNAYFGQDNIVIILNEQDAPRAYEILRGEIARG